jgi:hypothetical protein
VTNSRRVLLLRCRTRDKLWSAASMGSSSGQLVRSDDCSRRIAIAP